MKCTTRCVKNPLGKATGWPTDERRKLLKSRRFQHPSCQPNVKRFSVFKFLSCKPLVFFFSVAYPLYQVLESTSRLVLINDILHEVFLVAGFTDDQLGFCKLASGE